MSLLLGYELGTVRSGARSADAPPRAEVLHLRFNQSAEECLRSRKRSRKERVRRMRRRGGTR
eukprot:1638212-Rhodomonas_salina.1